MHRARGGQVPPSTGQQRREELLAAWIHGSRFLAFHVEKRSVMANTPLSDRPSILSSTVYTSRSTHLSRNKQIERARVLSPLSQGLCTPGPKSGQEVSRFEDSAQSGNNCANRSTVSVRPVRSSVQKSKRIPSRIDTGRLLGSVVRHPACCFEWLSAHTRYTTQLLSQPHAALLTQISTHAVHRVPGAGLGCATTTSPAEAVVLSTDGIRTA